MPKIAIVGPESTGKSKLSAELAQARNGIWIPEVARGFLEKLDRPYSQDDVLEIARLQMAADVKEHDAGWIFLDTNLLVLQVWMEVAYKNVPEWIPDFLQSKPSQPDYYLLTYPDLPWEPDPLREHPEMRQELFDRYQALLEFYKLPYGVVRGDKEQRIQNAEFLVDQFFENQAPKHFGLL